MLPLISSCKTPFDPQKMRLLDLHTQTKPRQRHQKPNIHTSKLFVLYGCSFLHYYRVEYCRSSSATKRPLAHLSHQPTSSGSRGTNAELNKSDTRRRRRRDMPANDTALILPENKRRRRVVDPHSSVNGHSHERPSVHGAPENNGRASPHDLQKWPHSNPHSDGSSNGYGYDESHVASGFRGDHEGGSVRYRDENSSDRQLGEGGTSGIHYLEKGGTKSGRHLQAVGSGRHLGEGGISSVCNVEEVNIGRHLSHSHYGSDQSSTNTAHRYQAARGGSSDSSSKTLLRDQSMRNSFVASTSSSKAYVHDRASYSNSSASSASRYDIKRRSVSSHASHVGTDYRRSHHSAQAPHIGAPSHSSRASPSQASQYSHGRHSQYPAPNKQAYDFQPRSHSHSARGRPSHERSNHPIGSYPSAPPAHPTRAFSGHNARDFVSNGQGTDTLIHAHKKRRVSSDTIVKYESTSNSHSGLGRTSSPSMSASALSSAAVSSASFAPVASSASIATSSPTSTAAPMPSITSSYSTLPFGRDVVKKEIKHEMNDIWEDLNELDSDGAGSDPMWEDEPSPSESHNTRSRRVRRAPPSVGATSSSSAPSTSFTAVPLAEAGLIKEEMNVESMQLMSQPSQEPNYLHSDNVAPDQMPLASFSINSRSSSSAPTASVSSGPAREEDAIKVEIEGNMGNDRTEADHAGSSYPFSTPTASLSSGAVRTEGPIKEETSGEMGDVRRTEVDHDDTVRRDAAIKEETSGEIGTEHDVLSHSLSASTALPDSARGEAAMKDEANGETDDHCWKEVEHDGTACRDGGTTEETQLQSERGDLHPTNAEHEGTSHSSSAPSALPDSTRGEAVMKDEANGEMGDPRRKDAEHDGTSHSSSAPSALPDSAPLSAKDTAKEEVNVGGSEPCTNLNHVSSSAPIASLASAPLGEEVGIEEETVVERWENPQEPHSTFSLQLLLVLHCFRSCSDWIVYSIRSCS